MVFCHLVERNFIHSETHPSCVRDLVEYFTRIVYLVLLNDCGHFIWTYIRIQEHKEICV